MGSLFQRILSSIIGTLWKTLSDKDEHVLQFRVLLRAKNCGVSHFVGKYAQVTNNPENDGCINAVLLV